MLDALRASTQTWVGRSIMAIVMGFLIIAFGFWGIGDIFRGFHANQLARVGPTEISTDAYRSAYQNELLRLQQQQRRAITSDEARAMGLDREVLARLLNNALLDQEGHRLGLAMSDAELAKRIMQDDAFKGADGKFDRQLFQSRLYDNNVTEQRFESEQRQNYLRQELLSAVNNGLDAPKAMLEIINRYYNEVRSIDYVVLPKSAAGTIPAPTDAQLRAYFDAHSADYRTPEYRKVSALIITPQSLADALAKTYPISEDEVRKHYEAVKDTHYTTPESRHVEQMVFPDEASANAASAKLASGETFEQLMAQRKLTEKDVDLGTVTPSGLVDKNVANTAFALPAGGASKPIKVQFGWAIVRAEKVSPKIVIPFVAVKDAIAQDLALDRAKNDISKIHDQIEDQRTSGKSVADAAEAVGLQARTIDAIDAQGRDKSGQTIAGLGDPQALLKAIFASDIGVDNDALEIKDGGWIWFDVLGTEPARGQTFDEVKKKVTQAWTDEETQKHLSSNAADLVHKLNTGSLLNTVAASQGNLLIKHVAGIKRSEGQGLSTDQLAQVFNHGVGTAGAVATSDGARVVFKVADAKTPPLDLKNGSLQPILDQLKTALNEDMDTQYVAQLENIIGVRINQQAFQSIVGSAETQ